MATWGQAKPWELEHCLAFLFLFTLFCFALAVSFFKSKIRLVAKKVEESIVFYSSLSSFFEFGVCNRAIWLYLVRLSWSCFIWHFFFLYVGFRFVNNWNPIFKIHFIIFLNFLGNQTVDHLVLSYSSIFLSLSCNLKKKNFIY